MANIKQLKQNIIDGQIETSSNIYPITTSDAVVRVKNNENNILLENSLQNIETDITNLQSVTENNIVASKIPVKENESIQLKVKNYNINPKTTALDVSYKTSNVNATINNIETQVNELKEKNMVTYSGTDTSQLQANKMNINPKTIATNVTRSDNSKDVETSIANLEDKTQNNITATTAPTINNSSVQLKVGDYNVNPKSTASNISYNINSNVETTLDNINQSIQTLEEKNVVTYNTSNTSQLQANGININPKTIVENITYTSSQNLKQKINDMDNKYNNIHVYSSEDQIPSVMEENHFYVVYKQ